MTEAECVAEMGQAIHIMLTFKEQDIGAMLNTLTERELKA